MACSLAEFSVPNRTPAPNDALKSYKIGAMIGVCSGAITAMWAAMRDQYPQCTGGPTTPDELRRFASFVSYYVQTVPGAGEGDAMAALRNAVIANYCRDVR
jgi:hypothetical protein